MPVLKFQRVNITEDYTPSSVGQRYIFNLLLLGEGHS
jgi:hypothetical protein